MDTFSRSLYQTQRLAVHLKGDEALRSYIYLFIPVKTKSKVQEGTSRCIIKRT